VASDGSIARFRLTEAGTLDGLSQLGLNGEAIMKKIGMTFVCVLLAACGGSSKGGAQEPVPNAPVESAEAAEAEEAVSAEPEDTTYAAPGPAAEAPATDEGAPTGATPAAPEPAMPTRVVATAELLSVADGSSMGTIIFERDAGGMVTISGEFTGLKKNGVHALYVHQNGDCSNKGKKVGPHLDPTSAKHGPPASSQRHAGDFGNLTADEAGHATFAMETDSVTLEGDRPDSVLNRAVVIHAKKDDKKGNAGAALACGVVQISE